MTRTALSLLALAALTACAPAGEPVDLTPTLSGVSEEADAQLELVDRAAALAGAEEADVALPGAPIDLGAAPDAFFMDFDVSAVTAMGPAGGPPPPSATYVNVTRGVAMATLAEVAGLAVIAPPAAAVQLVSQGSVTQLADNVWMATNTVSDGQAWLSGRWTVAWVGVGWLAELRVTSSDGALQDHRWLAGFLSADSSLGWWDLYGQGGELVGVVEWLADGQGNGELGVAAMAGENAGDTLSFWSADGEDLIVFTDASLGEAAWVYADVDRSGEASAPDVNGGAPGCWAGEDAAEPFADVACE